MKKCMYCKSKESLKFDRYTEKYICDDCIDLSVVDLDNIIFEKLNKLDLFCTSNLKSTELQKDIQEYSNIKTYYSRMDVYKIIQETHDMFLHLYYNIEIEEEK